jgi:hypothetical protein
MPPSLRQPATHLDLGLGAKQAVVEAVVGPLGAREPALHGPLVVAQPLRLHTQRRDALPALPAVGQHLPCVG